MAASGESMRPSERHASALGAVAGSAKASTAPASLTADIAVIGAGPAGTAAAVIAAESGARVILIDAGSRPGGQYYRRPADPYLTSPAHHPWPAFDELEARLTAAAGGHRAGSRGPLTIRHAMTVWSASGTGPFTLRLRGDERHPDHLETITARAVVIATGAVDRQLPFPGWDLPGVMSGGAAQSLIKASGVLPGQRVVVAGTGPFLLAVAATVLEAGGTVAAVIEANSPERLLMRIPALLPQATHVNELARFTALLARHRVPYLRQHRVLAAHGDDLLTRVTVGRVDAQWRRTATASRDITCDALAIGFGFTAQLDLLQQLGAEVARQSDGGIAAVIDSAQRTTVPGVLACGETTGIGGAELALREGLVAGAAAARAVGCEPVLRDRELTRDIAWVRRNRAAQSALQSAFAVHEGWQADLAPDTIVCRCEEVTAGQVRSAIVDLGATDARTVKLLTRAGMGWCQGRMCAVGVEGMCAQFGPSDPRGGIRPIAVPVPLGALAALASGSEQAAQES